MLSPKDVIKKSYLKKKLTDKEFENNAKVIQASYATISSFKEYTKYLIDSIDRAIYHAFGLNEEECEFLINYALEFRTDG